MPGLLSAGNWALQKECNPALGERSHHIPDPKRGLGQNRMYQLNTNFHPQYGLQAVCI